MSSTEEHQKILFKLDQLQKDFEFHINEAHANIMEAEEVIQRDEFILQRFEEFTKVTGRQLTELTDHIDELAKIILGNKTIDFDGQIVRENGLAQNVEELTILVKDLKSSRARVQLSKGQFFAFLGTIITTLGGIFVALIQL